MMTLKGNWNYPASIWFGAGRIRELADACAQLKVKKPLLVTDPSLAKMEMVRAASASIEKAGLAVKIFSNIRPNPVEGNVVQGVKAYIDYGCDGVIGMGGGSALDVAKAVALMVGQVRPLFDFADAGDNWTRADRSAIAPIVAIPTTSGTGSEVGRCSVITDESGHTKRVIFHPKMLPRRIIADPELTIAMPPALTAQVGMDALGHNLEAFFAPAYHPMADGIALEGMRLVNEYLVAATRDGTDITARANLMVASTMGATAFQKGLGAVHAMAHPVSAVLDTHHGLAISVFLPYVMAFNIRAVQQKAERLKRLLGIDCGLVEWLVNLRSDLHLPHTAAEIGVTEDMVEKLAVSAMGDPTLATNPVPMTQIDVENLYRSAISGELP